MGDELHRKFQKLGLFHFEDSPEQRLKRKQRKITGAKCGHVVRRLNKHEPLIGKTLEFALSTIEGEGASKDPLFRSIADKLKAGQKLGDYEYHIFVDVVLLHTRLF
jgi:hypothetical protein